MNDVSGIELNRTVAQQCFHRGNLAAAEVICRNILDVNPADAEMLHLIGIIADRVGMHDHAARYFLCALSANPNHAARDSLNALRANALLADARPQRRSWDPKYLVIKSWGFGFWSDVLQVLAPCCWRRSPAASLWCTGVATACLAMARLPTPSTIILNPFRTWHLKT